MLRDPAHSKTRGNIQELESSFWEASINERLPLEGQGSRRPWRARGKLRDYRRKLPTLVPSKSPPPREFAEPTLDLTAAPSEGRSLTQQYYAERLSSAVAQRYLDGRNIPLVAPDQYRRRGRNVSYQAPPLFNWPSSGPWYGNYVGPDDPDNRADSANRPAPRTPVDRAAMEHDLDYYRIQPKHGFTPTGAMGWLEGFYSLDSGLQFELGVADAKLAMNAPLYFARGIFDGSYGLDDFSSDERHKAFASDLTWAIGISSTHVVLATHRFGMAALGLILEGGREVSEGIIRWGKSVGGVGGTLIQGIGYATGAFVEVTVGIARVAWSIGSAGLLIGIGIANLVFAPLTYAAAYVGAKLISAIVTVGKAIWEGIKSIGEAIGDFFDSIFMLSEAARLSAGADVRIRDCMLELRTYIRQEDIDGRFLNDYYSSAPLIAAEIEKRPDASMVWLDVFEKWVRPCVQCVQRADYVGAYELFREMLDDLATRTGVRIGEDRFARHWKRPCVTT